MKSCLAFVLLLLSLRAGAEEHPRTPAAKSRYFIFYSDYETNLNDALVNTGFARTRHKPELFHSGENASCFEKLAASTRAAWDSAVDYYGKVISPGRFFERRQFLIRMALAGFNDELKT